LKNRRVLLLVGLYLTSVQAKTEDLLRISLAEAQSAAEVQMRLEALEKGALYRRVCIYELAQETPPVHCFLMPERQKWESSSESQIKKVQLENLCQIRAQTLRSVESVQSLLLVEGVSTQCQRNLQKRLTILRYKSEDTVSGLRTF
jgi:hypothetical protein